MRDNIAQKVSRFIRDHQLIQTGDKVLVALSGGADSVVLLDVLISLKEEFHIPLYAAHFHHGIRGAEADRDEDFVRELCEKRQMPLYCEKADVPAIAARLGESVELCGRNLRYRFFEKVARQLGGAKIATAHHSSDNAETVLWNLTRGTGIGGLCGIPVRRGNIIRPLLCLSRCEIEDYCRENALEYVEDSTNFSDDYTRNRLRRQVTPVLRELNPAMEEHIRSTSWLMREADDYLNKISIEELKSIKTPFGFSCKKLLCLEPIILKYALKRVLEEAGAPVDCRHIAMMIEAMRQNGAVSLGQGYTAACAQGNLRIICETDAQDSGGELNVPFTEYIKTNGVRITVHDGKADLSSVACPDLTDSKKINNLLLNHGIPCDIITPDTVLRSRRAGDTFTDPRRGVTKTIKKLFNELKIPREERDTIPLVAQGSTVLWISGIGASAQAKTDLTRDGDIILLFGGLHNA